MYLKLSVALDDELIWSAIPHAPPVRVQRSQVSQGRPCRRRQTPMAHWYAPPATRGRRKRATGRQRPSPWQRSSSPVAPPSSAATPGAPCRTSSTSATTRGRKARRRYVLWRLALRTGPLSATAVADPESADRLTGRHLRSARSSPRASLA